jgi:hypothetical protein
MNTFDPDYTLRYIQRTPRYRHAARAIYPDAVYPDHAYPLTVAIVQLPVSLPFRCERVVWHSSQLHHAESQLRADRHELFALFSSCDLTGKPLFEVLFIGDQVLTVYKKWVVFVDKTGKNLLRTYYATHPHPAYEAYERIVVNPSFGGVFADHSHLRSLLRGVCNF